MSAIDYYDNAHYPSTPDPDFAPWESLNLAGLPPLPAVVDAPVSVRPMLDSTEGIEVLLSYGECFEFWGGATPGTSMDADDPDEEPWDAAARALVRTFGFAVLAGRAPNPA